MLNHDCLDLDFKNQVASKPGGEKVTNCFLCGTCTAGCPVSSLNGQYNPRRIMKMVLLGMKKDVLSLPEIWHCNQCHTCVAHCPQDVRFADIMRILRQMACDEGCVSKDLIDKVDSLDMEIRKQRIDKINELIK